MRESIEELMVRLCRRDALDRLSPDDAERICAPGAKGTFLRECARHGVRALVLSRLDEWANTRDGAKVELDGVLGPLPLLRKQAMLWDLEQDRVLAALVSADLPAIVLKGGALRRTVYARPIERWMGDLDLLVRPDRMEALLEVLGELGYDSGYSDQARRGIEAHHFHHVVNHPSGFIIEAHQGLTRPGSTCSLDTDDFFRGAREFHPVGGPPMLVPGPEDMILHLVSQIEQEGCRRLSRIVDIDRVLASSGEVDWVALETRAGEGNLGVALAVSLRLADILLSTPVPSSRLDGSSLPAASRRALDVLQPVAHLLRGEDGVTVASDDLFRLWLLPTWPQRRARIRELASRTADPLAWIWEGADSPEEDASRTGGVGRILKLVAYGAWVETGGRFGGRSRRVGGGRFWAAS